MADDMKGLIELGWFGEMPDPDWPRKQLLADLRECGPSRLCEIRERFNGTRHTPDADAVLLAELLKMQSDGLVVAREGRWTVQDEVPRA